VELEQLDEVDTADSELTDLDGAAAMSPNVDRNARLTPESVHGEAPGLTAS
jgi:hypothetical protein